MWNDDFIDWRTAMKKAQYPEKIDQIKNIGVFVGTTRKPLALITNEHWNIKYVSKTTFDNSNIVTEFSL